MSSTTESRRHGEIGEGDCMVLLRDSVVNGSTNNSSEEDFRIVVEGNGSFTLQRSKNPATHGATARTVDRWRRECTTKKRRVLRAGKIESLLRAKTSQLKRPRRKEFANNIGRAFVADLAVVRPMLQKKVFVLREKGVPWVSLSFQISATQPPA